MRKRAIRRRNDQYPPTRERFILPNPPAGSDAFGLYAGAHLVAVKKTSVKPLGESIRTAEGAQRFLGGLAKAPVERLIVVPLDQAHRPLGAVIASQGSVNETVVHPREVLAPVIEARAAAFLIAHNHPSGECAASPQDVAMTRRLVKAAHLVGIPMLDSLVVCGGSALTSLQRERPDLFREPPEEELARENPPRKRRRRNPLTARQRRALSSWKTQARLQAAAWPGHTSVKRVPAFLRYWDPSFHGVSGTVRSLKAARAFDNPRRVKKTTKKTTKRKVAKRRVARRPVVKRLSRASPAYDPTPSRTAARTEGDRRLGILRDHLASTYGQLHPSDWAVIARGGVVPPDVSRRYDLARKSGMTLNPRSTRRRNPWPAFLNGMAGGVGFFAANRALGAVVKGNQTKRRKRRNPLDWTVLGTTALAAGGASYLGARAGRPRAAVKAAPKRRAPSCRRRSISRVTIHAKRVRVTGRRVKRKGGHR